MLTNKNMFIWCNVYLETALFTFYCVKRTENRLKINIKPYVENFVNLLT